MFSVSANPTVLAEIMQHAAGSRKFNLAASKPENMGKAVETVLISSLQAEISVFPV